ncbi:MAG: hypothetical protein WCJ37_11055 [Syntrophus sp. (in: bacteria)]
MSISLYTDEQEEKIFISSEARTWTRSGLITDEQFGIINARTNTGVSQTNVFFRILFFLFTLACVIAVVGFYLWATGIRNEVTVAWSLMAFSIPFYVLAETLVKRNSFYRHGIEEALALSSTLLLCAGFVLLMNVLKSEPRLFILAGSLLMAASAFWVYLRFGFLYAAFIAVAALCVVPFQLSLSPANERVALVSILMLMLWMNLRKCLPTNEDFKKEKLATIQAFLLAGIYLAVNLRLPELFRIQSGYPGISDRSFAGFAPLFYWTTYVLTFLVPALGLYYGLKNRIRLIIDVSLVSAVITLATNKDYLGLKHYEWDPAILGVVMVIVAGFIIRWLIGGNNGMRHGYTARNMLKPENYGISPADLGTAVVIGEIAANQPSIQPEKPFSGGESGGGGVSSGY